MNLNEKKWPQTYITEKNACHAVASHIECIILPKYSFTKQLISDRKQYLHSAKKKKRTFNICIVIMTTVHRFRVTT